MTFSVHFRIVQMKSKRYAIQVMNPYCQNVMDEVYMPAYKTLSERFDSLEEAQAWIDDHTVEKYYE